MSINSDFYIHESDLAALEALKSIPGFSSFLKSFMKNWNEKLFRMQNMSTNLRLGENQMKKYYDMLPPICEKLGIEVPELYLTMNVIPNAYTYGDSKPVIVMTTGLIDLLPEELIPTVLAHECGHIACHHVLYRTMGQMLFNGVIRTIGLGGLITAPLEAAFAYWMRCSEYSADRAAAICDGTGEKVVRMCMCFAGHDRKVPAMASIDSFMKQAEEYIELTKQSKTNKTIEFLMFGHMSHPLNAVRAYECRKWTRESHFEKIQNYLNKQESGLSFDDLPFPFSSKAAAGKNHEELISRLQDIGFTNLSAERTTEKSLFFGADETISVSLDGETSFPVGKWVKKDAPITITYYKPLSEEELRTVREGKIRVPLSARSCGGLYYMDVAKMFNDAGFTRIFARKTTEKPGWLVKPEAVASISIGEDTTFSKDAWFEPDSKITILYYPKV